MGKGKGKKGAVRLTVMGVGVDVDPRALCDARVFRRLRSITRSAYDKDKASMDTTIYAMHDLIDEMLGEEQAERVLSELADEDGFVSDGDVGAFIGSLIGQGVPKNSASARPDGEGSPES